jgi:transcriptional regulator with XRE-family HTH domain
MEASVMHEQTAVKSGEHDSFETDAEHVMPPELPTQDSALEDSVGQLSRVQSKLVDTLHSLQLLPPHLVKDHNRAVRAVQEALTLVGDTDDSEAIGPIDWVKFGERLLQRRTAAALTQEWLADRVGVTATTIRQLEHHNRKARRSLMLKLLAVPELNLRVSDIELSAEMSAGYRLTPTSWLGMTYDPVSMITELADTLNGPEWSARADAGVHRSSQREGLDGDVLYARVQLRVPRQRAFCDDGSSTDRRPVASRR